MPSLLCPVLDRSSALDNGFSIFCDSHIQGGPISAYGLYISSADNSHNSFAIDPSVAAPPASTILGLHGISVALLSSVIVSYGYPTLVREY